jgi:hypothetical protein
MVEAIVKHKSNVTINSVENESFWHRHIQSFKISGVTRAKYCRLHKINYHRFGYWLKKSVPHSAPLVPVMIKPNNESSLSQPPLCILNLRNGSHLTVYDLRALSFIMEKVV